MGSGQNAIVQNATGQNASDKMSRDKMPCDKMLLDKMPRQNATNIEICFYFLLMLFQLVALGFKARNASKCKHPIRRFVLSALSLHPPTKCSHCSCFTKWPPAMPVWIYSQPDQRHFVLFHIYPREGVHLITELTESVPSKPRNPLGTTCTRCKKVVTAKDDLHQV